MRTLIILLFIVSLSIDCSTAVGQEPGSDTRLRVGVILPLTGELAPFGEAFRQGIELAESQGPTGISYLYEDDASGNRANTVSALRSLIQRAHIQVAIVTGYPTLVPTDAIVKREGVLALSAFDSNELIETLSPNSFGFGWSNEETGREIGGFACSSLGIRKATVIVGHDEWSALLGRMFEQSIRSCAGEILARETVDMNATDFRALAVRIRKSDTEAVYLPLYGAGLVPMIKQLRQAGFKGALLSAEAVTQAELKQLGSLAEGLVITAPSLSDPEFEARYRKHFALPKVELNLAYVAIGYEMTRFLAQVVRNSMRKGAELDTDALRTGIRTAEFYDILGAVSFKDRRHVTRSQRVLVVRSGKLVIP